jgi:hypothetical protein
MKQCIPILALATTMAALAACEQPTNVAPPMPELQPLLSSTPSAIVFNPANGHYYQAVRVSGKINYADAKAAAASLSHMGVQGHLVTITSQAESDFIIASFRTRSIPIRALPGGASTKATGSVYLRRRHRELKRGPVEIVLLHLTLLRPRRFGGAAGRGTGYRAYARGRGIGAACGGGRRRASVGPPSLVQAPPPPYTLRDKVYGNAEHRSWTGN